MYYVYTIKSLKDGSIYIGYTNDLKRRIKEHNEGKNNSTKHKKPFKLIYYEAYSAEYDAKEREWQLKKHAQALVQLKKRIVNCINK